MGKTELQDWKEQYFLRNLDECGQGLELHRLWSQFGRTS
jgi:hypothetical protein